MSAERVVELRFPVSGETIPTDHGWPLFAAMSAVCEQIHDDTRVVVGPVSGASFVGSGRLSLGLESYVPVRCPAAVAAELFRLAGRGLQVQGARVKLGVPRSWMLRSVASLNARVVVLTNHEAWPSFEGELRRQLEVRGVEAEITPGRRRVLSIRGARYVGYAVGLSGLSAEGSLRVQELGLGGRRSMGAGFFVPGALPPGALATVEDLNLTPREAP